MNRRPGLSAPAFTLAVAIGLAIFILAMVVIGVRIDSGPSQPAPPSAAEEARQDAASAYDILATVAEASPSDPVLHEISLMARAHEKSVGGVWVPWPEGAPEGATNPPEPVPSSDDVEELLRESMIVTQRALEEVSSSSAPLYASILIRQQVALDSLVVTAEGEESIPGISADPLSPAQVGELATAQTLVELDTARQWLETAAPHLDSSDRALLRIGDLENYTSAIRDAGVDDQRLSFAPLPDWFVEDPSPETALRLEAEAYHLVASELFSYIPAQTTTTNTQIAVTALNFLSPSMRAQMEYFPLLNVTDE